MGDAVILPPRLRRHARRAAQPVWIAPMLATLTDRRFSDPGWIFERKLDGERCLARVGARGVTLFSRNRKSIGAAYPEIVEAVGRAARGPCFLDGEIVASRGSEQSFALLQRRMQLRDPERARQSGIRVEYHVFDLLHLGPWSFVDAPQLERKQALRRALSFGAGVRYVRHRREHGERYSREACRRGWEGLIAKRADAPYQPGRRSRDWLKFKCVAGQELVIGGFTDPQGSRVGLGALLVGYYDGDGRLRYAGKVGTGFDEQTLRALRRELGRLERRSPPFEPDPALPRRGVHWVRPGLVAQVGFSEWTSAGRLRHPRFLGLRRDKRAREVVREAPGA